MTGKIYSRVVALLRERRPQSIIGNLKPVAFALTLAWGCQAVPASAQVTKQVNGECPMSAGFYDREGYVVNAIRINTALGFIGVVREPLEAKLKESQASLGNRGLTVGQIFSNLGYTELSHDLTNRIGVLESGERFKFVGTVPSLLSCDTAAKRLDVVYQVVTSGPISYFARIFEKTPDRITRDLAPGAFSQTQGKIPLQPFVGYNRSRGIYVGSKASYKSHDDFINKIDVSSSGSGSSATADLALAGDRDFKSGVLDHAEWRLGYSYSSITSDPLELKDATVLGQIFGATRPLGDIGVVLRFGASVEGGNRQTNLDQNSLPLTDLARSGYGAAKFYVGGTLNHGRQSWKSSYGLQLGETGNGFRIEYLKHIVDTSYSIRILPSEHRPLRLETQFNAGFIQSSSGNIPVSERFFGGNATRDFIQGDEWRIRSGPFIRSIPQNRLNLVGQGLPIGGENFFSANLTISQTIWGRPAIPNDVLRDVRVKQGLGGQLAGSRLAAEASYLTETPRFGVLKATLKGDVDDFLDEILKDLRNINPPPASVATDLDEFKDDINAVKDIIAEKELDPTTGKMIDSPLEYRLVRNLAVGFGGDPGTSRIGKIIKTIREEILTPLTDANLIEQRDRLKAHSDKLEESRQAVQKIYQELTDIIAIDAQELKSAQSGLEEIGEHLDKLGTILDEIEAQVQPLPEDESQQAKDAINDARAYIDTSRLSVTAAGDTDADIAKNNLQLLAIGFGQVAPGMLIQVKKYVDALQQPLAKLGLADQANRLKAEVSALPQLQAGIKKGLKSVHISDIERKAIHDVRYSTDTLDVVFRELNLIGVSPLLILDAAHIGPQAMPGFGGTRYGVGGGIRISIVSLDLTAGYSWNLKHQSGEGRGAFVFSLDISDLFR